VLQSLDEVADRLCTPRYTLRAVETPGHSRDHVSYFEPSLRWLFCGDAFVGGRDLACTPELNLFAAVSSLRTLAGCGQSVCFRATALSAAPRCRNCSARLGPGPAGGRRAEAGGGRTHDSGDCPDAVRRGALSGTGGPSATFRRPTWSTPAASTTSWRRRPGSPAPRYRRRSAHPASELVDPPPFGQRRLAGPLKFRGSARPGGLVQQRKCCMRVLITPAAPVLSAPTWPTGSCERGSIVRVLDDLSSGDRTNLLSAVHFARGDAATCQNSGRAQGVEVVFHLAALVSVPASVLYPRRIQRCECRGHGPRSKPAGM
jgi:hypothetical protein